MKKMCGGLINIVHDHNSYVSKQYTDGGLVKGLGFSAKERFLNEINALSLFKNVSFFPLNVPNIISSDTKKLILLMEKINGLPVENTIRNNMSFFDSMDDARTLAHILKKIHSGSITYQSNIGDEYYSKAEEFIKKASPILEFENINIELLIKWMSVILEKLESCDSRKVSIHSDFWLNNILILKNYTKNKFVVIDWEFYNTGSVYEDLGVFYCNVHEHFIHSHLFCNFFFNAYGSNLDMEIVRGFAVYRCLRLLSFVELEVYKKTPTNYPHSFKELVEIIRNNIRF